VLTTAASMMPLRAAPRTDPRRSLHAWCRASARQLFTTSRPHLSRLPLKVVRTPWLLTGSGGLVGDGFRAAAAPPPSRCCCCAAAAAAALACQHASSPFQTRLSRMLSPRVKHNSV